MDKLFGLYSPEDNLISVHKTEVGAMKNWKVFTETHGEGFYVDFVTIHE